MDHKPVVLGRKFSIIVSGDNSAVESKLSRRVAIDRTEVVPVSAVVPFAVLGSDGSLVPVLCNKVSPATCVSVVSGGDHEDMLSHDILDTGDVPLEHLVIKEYGRLAVQWSECCHVTGLLVAGGLHVDLVPACGSVLPFGNSISVI